MVALSSVSRCADRRPSHRQVQPVRGRVVFFMETKVLYLFLHVCIPNNIMYYTICIYACKKYVFASTAGSRCADCREASVVSVETKVFYLFSYIYMPFYII